MRTTFDDFISLSPGVPVAADEPDAKVAMEDFWMAYGLDWLNLMMRWLRVITGIAWIGASFYFVWLDNTIKPPGAGSDLEKKGVSGELWAVHGGGFYNPQKYLLAPSVVPQELHWFKWEAYATWLSGFALLLIVYYFNASAMMIDKSVADIAPWQSIAIGMVALIAGWAVYDGLCRSALGRRDGLFGMIVFMLLTAAAWGLSQWLSGRAAYIHVGSMIGTIMVGNVLMVIIPGQKKMVAAMLRGQSPDPIHGQRGKQRSVHNNYFTLPLLFIMSSNHYAMTYNHAYGWLVLAAIMAAGVLIRHFFNLKHKGKIVWGYPAAGVALLLAVAFASNYSAPRVEVVDRLLAFLNAGIHPLMPQKGSVGASGDLAPLAYLAAAMAGFDEAEVMYQGRRMSAPEAIGLAGIGEIKFELQAKDASALINGCTVSLAVAVLAASDARNLLLDACVSLGLSLEAMRAEMAAFDARIHQARPHAGQIKAAAIIRKLLSGSTRTTHAARSVQLAEELRRTDIAYTPRIQDVYSMRCAPQVYGPVFDALAYIDGIVDTEINSATDNPLIFGKDGGGFEIISGGNFHGQYLAQAMDLLAISVTDLGSMCERRIARLIDPSLSWGLPRNLMSGVAGVNTGYPVVQCSMSSLVMENRTLCMPGSVDSIPAKGNSEDHVSNSTWCARKAATVVANTQYIVGVELLLAAQALTMTQAELAGFILGQGTQAAYEEVRRQIPACLDGDRWFHDDIQIAHSFVISGSVRAAVEMKIGSLE